ncbi:hypothetical protein C5167_010838 [Papaver somniferum]|uniref:CCG-binding protein 1 n=1 Tax=Papaver somniferum TaxID=3469 RepID=A0A4Y7K1D3_PAPSO|nr:CCG-binding protein 1-like [Papaver somniferum]XP_026394381.1 CCG-binding protein 1-like [Papaver somniferum]RZC67144.1 hypothetical protein C5167_010838 [Papaver somniferum]
MISSVPLPSSASSSLLFDTIDLPRNKYMIKPSSSMICCSSSSSSRSVPKLEPFSRNKIDRGIKELPFVQKSENELADYCSTLEGDKAYSCWRAYFELKDLENEFTKEELEMLVIQSGGVKSLIDCVHGITSMQKKKKNEEIVNESMKTINQEKKPFPVPDGLPKSQEEIDEEEESKMPDSSFTRLLRSKGKFPAWFSPVPDHETD